MITTRTFDGRIAEILYVDNKSMLGCIFDDNNIRHRCEWTPTGFPLTASPHMRDAILPNGDAFEARIALTPAQNRELSYMIYTLNLHQRAFVEFNNFRRINRRQASRIRYLILVALLIFWAAIGAIYAL